ncbi:MAG: hypothetical protein L0H26_10850, partial [Microlunatus sp.]|nr:hypothetical protein [Microlunatus sp.]
SWRAHSAAGSASKLIGSEGKRSDVLRIDVPTTTEDVPTPAAGESAPATPAASTAPSPQDTGANDDDLPPEAQPSATASRQGTLAALGIAAAVAVVAGVVVALVRRT